jgi:hypothetical protein
VGKGLVELYKRRTVERAFKASKLKLSVKKPKWRQKSAYMLQYVTHTSYRSNISPQIGRPELATT